jgi:hypothetical protein
MKRREFLRLGLLGVPLIVPFGKKIFGVDSIWDVMDMYNIQVVQEPVPEKSYVMGLRQRVILKANSLEHGELNRYVWPIQDPTPTSYKWFIDLRRPGRRVTIYPECYQNEFFGFYRTDDALVNSFKQMMDDIISGRPSRLALKGSYSETPLAPA